MSSTTENDDLFRPSVVDTTRGRAPWRLVSQIWVALLGGVLAITAIAWLNSGRLGVTRGRRIGILAAGAVGFAVVVLLYLVTPIPSIEETFAATSETRWSARLVAIVVWFATDRLQRTADRRWSLFGAERRASLWRPGIAAVVILGPAQLVLMLSLVYWKHA